MNQFPLYIRTLRKKGMEGHRGVFCSVDIPKDSIFEMAPVLVIPKKQHKSVYGTIISDYHYEYSDNGDSCLALGYGSLYNHSFNPNAEYEMLVKTSEMAFRALRKITAGEEIRVNYNGDFDNLEEVWFEVKE